MTIADVTAKYRTHHIALENKSLEDADNVSEESLLPEALIAIHAIYQRCHQKGMTCDVHRAPNTVPKKSWGKSFTDEVSEYNDLTDIPANILSDLVRNTIQEGCNAIVDSSYDMGCRAFRVHHLVSAIRYVKAIGTGNPLAIEVDYHVCSGDHNRGAAPSWG